ncbi:unnamed protein product, partial [marine sediment metagenome]
DALQDYKRVPLTIFDSGAGLAQKKVVLELFGVIKQSEAWRAGMYRLACNKLLKSTIEFEANIDAIACTIGDVIYVQHDVPEWGAGGRVLSATSNTVTIEQSLQVSEGTDEIKIKVYNPTTKEDQIETHLVSNISGPIITIEDTWSKCPKYHKTISHTSC